MKFGKIFWSSSSAFFVSYLSSLPLVVFLALFQKDPSLMDYTVLE